MSGRRAGVALAATLHDPAGALRDEVARWLPKLRALYATVDVACSPPTDRDLRAALAAQDADAGVPASRRLPRVVDARQGGAPTSRRLPRAVDARQGSAPTSRRLPRAVDARQGSVPTSNTRGPLYRLALRRALARGTTHVHYLDFDRALHWIARRPDELVRLLARARRHRAVLVGRTPRAHASHHEALVATETEANAGFARRLGLPARVDFLVPSFVLDRAATARLLARSRAIGSTMYGEWVGLLPGLGVPLRYAECDGLDWETPDRHRAEVRCVGFAAWRRAMSTPAEWAMRGAMQAEFERGLARALRRFPVRTPVGIVRLR